MPSFELKKSEKFSLAKATAKFTVGVGWDTEIDLDASAFACVSNGGNPKFYNDGSHAVFYGNRSLKQSDGSFVTSDGSIRHSGDNLNGIDRAGTKDDEEIQINTDKLPAEIDEIGIFVTIYDAAAKEKSFADVRDAYVRIIDNSGVELCRYNLSNEFSSASVQVGNLIKENGEWAFHAIGAGFNQEIGAIIEKLS